MTLKHLNNDDVILEIQQQQFGPITMPTLSSWFILDYLDRMYLSYPEGSFPSVGASRSWLDGRSVWNRMETKWKQTFQKNKCKATLFGLPFFLFLDNYMPFFLSLHTFMFSFLSFHTLMPVSFSFSSHFCLCLSFFLSLHTLMPVSLSFFSQFCLCLSSCLSLPH